jgi:hypothetical protein
MTPTFLQAGSIRATDLTSRCPNHSLQAVPHRLGQAQWSASSTRLRRLCLLQESRYQRHHHSVLAERLPTLFRLIGHFGAAKSGPNGPDSSAILAVRTRGRGGSNMGIVLRTIPPRGRAISSSGSVPTASPEASKRSLTSASSARPEPLSRTTFATPTGFW